MQLEEYLIKNKIEYKKENDNLTVGGYLDLRRTGITTLPDNLTVGGSLDLCRTGITTLPDNMTVGGYLDLCGTAITSLPDNMTVGGSLDLCRTGITTLPDNMTVGLNKKLNTHKEFVQSKMTWKNGKYRKIDGIFCEVLKVVKNVLKVKIGLKVKFIVEVGGVFSHGDTIKEAKNDLIYKISSRDTSEYKKWNLTTKITKEQAIKSYRAITGACEFGVKNFLKDKKIPRNITPKKIIEMTVGQYGNDNYRKFFENLV